ncbi:MAG: hypothetical protein ACE37F_19215 [Nannocystaceae bacterium]|nr:hypothetical protein [bacterium]
MRDSDRAIARQALRETAPLALLGVALCGALELQWTKSFVAIDIPIGSTWPLSIVAALAAWAGIAVFGELRDTLAHALARPLSRGRLLAVRTVVPIAVLTVVALVFHALAGPFDSGPPFALMVGFAGLAFGIGAFAGASTSTETAAVGATLVGVALCVAPVVLVFEFYAVSWASIDSALGPWLWPAALLGALGTVWPTWWVVGTMPIRSPRRIAAGVGALALFELLSVVLVWRPVAAEATSSVHGQMIAIDGVLGGPRVVFTSQGTRVDGVYVDEDDTRRHLFGEGAQRERIVNAALSPDGQAIALLVRQDAVESSRVVLVDLRSGRRVATRRAPSARLGVWAPDAHEMAFLGQGEHTPLHILSAEGRTTRVIPPSSHGRFTRLLGWTRRGIVADHGFGFELISADDEGTRRSFDGRAPRAFSETGFAWIDLEGERGWAAPRGTHRRLVIEGWNDEPAVEVELEAWPISKISGFGYLDPDHVYVQFTEWDGKKGLIGSTSPRRLYIVHRSGEVRAAVQRDLGGRVHSLRGPPEGPWLETGVYGTIRVVGSDGHTLTRRQGRNLGGRSLRWIPTREVEGGIAFVENGHLATLFPEYFQ